MMRAASVGIEEGWGQNGTLHKPLHKADDIRLLRSVQQSQKEILTVIQASDLLRITLAAAQACPCHAVALASDSTCDVTY